MSVRLSFDFYNLRTIVDWIRYGASEFARRDLFFGHGTDNALDDAAALVLGLLQLPFDLAPLYFQASLTTAEKKQLTEGFRRRIEEEVPVPYITRRTLYGGHEFYIDERALIPRSPIAELIERDLAPYWTGEAPRRILDLCCGSGCLGILAKYRYPETKIVLADNDRDALAVAEINLARAGMTESGIKTLCSDGFSAISATFDWILCNPPYVEAAEMATIAAEYRHEPRNALVSGEDGLEFTRKLLREAGDFLAEDGLLVLEVGMNWPILETAYPDIGFDWFVCTRGGEGVFAVGREELLAWREAGLL